MRSIASRPASRLLGAAIVLAGLTGGSLSTLHSQGAHAGMAHYTLKLSHFTMPASIPAGMVEVTVINDTKAQGEASFGAEKPGVTDKQAIAIINDQSDQGFARALKAITFVGGVDSVEPGQTASVVITLTPGRYGVTNTSGQKPQYALFSVTAPAGQSAAAPMADATVVLKDMKFVGLPKHLAAGSITFKVVNSGPSVHHMILIRLDAGKTQKDVLKALQGQSQPKWAHTAGGMDVISPHHSAYLTMNLVAGTYVAICFMPDLSKGGEPHAMEGMISSFTVS